MALVSIQAPILPRSRSLHGNTVFQNEADCLEYLVTS
jgi:hypothetical protein